MFIYNVESSWVFIILTDADDDEGCHSVENAEVFHSKRHMIQEERHETAQTNTGQAKERQKHWGETKYAIWRIYYL